MHRVDRTVRRDGRHHAPHGRSRRTDADLFTLHRAEILRNAHFVDIGVAAHLLRNGNKDTSREGEEHNAEDPGGQLAATHIEPESPSHRHRDNQNRPALQHVREGVGILQRMRGIDAEIAAAIGAQLFDRHNGRRGTLGDDLLVAFERSDGLFAVERHRCAVDHQQNTDQKRQRHQDTGRTLDEEHPEIADGFSGLARQRFHDTGHGCHTARCGDELEEHDHEQLREISKTAFTAIMLQVAVHHERDTGVECQVGCLVGITVGIERQPTLAAEQHHAPEEPEKVDHQQRLEELLPVHILVGIDAANLVNAPFERCHEIEPRTLASVYFGNVASQRIT